MPSNLETFAESELRRAGAFDESGAYMGALGPAVMKMVKIFAEEGHSGTSASLAINMFQRVARFQPLTPLTGEDDEWNECGDGVWQNRRSPRVFKEADGRAYDIEGRVFREPSGVCFTNKDSFVYVDFPYTPTTEYVDAPSEAAE
jgi:hypothetical protein